MKNVIKKGTAILFLGAILMTGCQQETETEEMFDKVTDKVEKMSATEQQKTKKVSPD